VDRIAARAVWTFLLAAAPAFAQPVFPPAGADAFESAMSVVVTVGAQTRTIDLVGPTAVLRSDPETGDGGRRLLRTELVAMDLRGTDAVFGEVRVQLDPTKSSVGEVRAQNAGADFPADSFFDVFVVVTVPLTGELVNLVPVRVEAQGIQKLPPIFDTYQHPPPAIPLVSRANPGAGTIATIGGGSTHRPEQLPTFSVKPGASIDAADLLEIGNPPVVGLTRASLGLVAGDDVTSLSYGTDAFAEGQTTVAFSVDPASDGVVGSAVRLQSVAAEAHGDEFVSYLNATNQQLVDESSLVLSTAADVDALTNQPTRAVDQDDDGVAERPVFFSLAPGSPTLGTLGASAGDLLVSKAGVVSIFATRAAMGLEPGDVVDALCLQKAGLPFTNLRAGSVLQAPPRNPGDANFDHALISLAPSSPSLAARGISAADLLATNFSASRPNLAVGNPPPVFASAADLGLLATDDVDALKCLTPVSFVEIDGYGDLDGAGNGTGCADDETDVGLFFDIGIDEHDGDFLAEPAPEGEPGFFELWSIQNPVVGDYHGPYALPETEAEIFFLGVEPGIDVAFVGGPGDNCGLPHVHGGFFGVPDYDRFGLHPDLDPGACGHGVFVPTAVPIFSIPTRRNVLAFTPEVVTFLVQHYGLRFLFAWHQYTLQQTILAATDCAAPSRPRAVIAMAGLTILQLNMLLHAPLSAAGPPALVPRAPGAPTPPPLRIGAPVALLDVPLVPEPGAIGSAAAALAAMAILRRRRDGRGGARRLS
jgi:hypothetical protein